MSYGLGITGAFSDPIAVEDVDMLDLTERSCTPISQYTEESTPAPEPVKYELRPGPRLNSCVTFYTWLDNDESGTYDPIAKDCDPSPRKRIRLSPPSSPRLPNSSDGERTPKKPSWLAGRQQGWDLIICIKFTSEAGKKLIASIAENWPTEDCNIFQNDPSLLDSKETEDLDSDSLLAQKLQRGYNLRRTRRPTVRSTLRNQSRHFTGGIDLTQDLTGHPVARGCRACLELSTRCPLLDDDTAWPCAACIEDDCDCELITPPPRKAGCQRCRQKKIACSYNQPGGDHSKSCEQCEESSGHCVAGPAHGFLGKRISYDRDWSIPIPQARRPYVTCTACRQDKKSCSLKNTRDQPPCSSCISANIACTFEPVRRTKPKKLITQRTSTGITVSPPPTTTLANHRAPTPAPPPLTDGTRLSLPTPFAHPIHFNYLPPTPHFPPCTFCTTPTFPVFGYGLTTALVESHDAGLSYHELANGHLQMTPGAEETRVCVWCTMVRVLVVACGEHEIRAIEGEGGAGKEGVEGFFGVLLKGEGWEGWRCCSVCPRPAVYECCRPRDEMFSVPSMGGDEDGKKEGNEQEGCGLALCQFCAVRLEEECDGDLQVMLRGLKAVEEGREGGDVYPMGLRGDLEFLREDGLLMRNVLAGSEG